MTQTRRRWRHSSGGSSWRRFGFEVLRVIGVMLALAILLRAMSHQAWTPEMFATLERPGEGIVLVGR